MKDTTTVIFMLDQYTHLEIEVIDMVVPCPIDE